LSALGIKDSVIDTAIWIGKSNFGRKKADWWVCTPSHPNCSDTFSRIDPENQEWDKKEKRIKYKHGQEFEKYLPSWFVKEKETLQAKRQKQEDLAAKKREENYYKTKEQVIKEAAIAKERREEEQERLEKEWLALPKEKRK
jgi:hypothetical protein